MKINTTQLLSSHTLYDLYWPLSDILNEKSHWDKVHNARCPMAVGVVIQQLQN